MAVQLTRWPSVTGTPDEALFPARLAEALRTEPYFELTPDDLAVLPIPGDPLGRSFSSRWSAAAARGRWC
jgi:arginine utilization protein RocB